ncbi:putative MFS family arabinose efflux permease [Kribbella orskensis]|uniref:MFS family arabinose efflux permease n=2 Tax=Kribbellaceae TaxID=2726069 RepID=A0ABY2BJ30_9ACTN|nr:putative MFS family arabinose efflux permease [Kribbella sp. VKM Ac-2500]TCO21932.1 putative MFS family arabinose efflux permease [Kribbella orskensis]
MRLMDLSAYRALWQTRGVFALLASALLARLPVMAALVPVAFLAKDAAGNFGWAGVVAGAYSVGMAVGGPIWSRLADRRGGRRVVIGTGMAWGVAMAVLALLPDDWYRLMPLVSALAGAVVSPVTATLRASWPRLVQGSRLRAVYALDATAQEVLFSIGPLLGAVIVSFASPRAGVLVAAASAAVSIWWFGLRQPPALPHDESAGARLTAPQLLWHRYRLPLILAFGLFVTAFASISLGIVAFADDHGNRLIAGVLETVWAVGSLIGGVVVGALPGRRNSYVWRRALLVSIGMLVCVFATWSPVSLAIALLLSGCALAPTVGALYERLGAMTPDSVRTEVFGWMGSGAMIGGAVGSSVAGLVVETFGVRYVWLMASILALLATLAVLHVPPHRPEVNEAEEEVPSLAVTT